MGAQTSAHSKSHAEHGPRGVTHGSPEYHWHAQRSEYPAANIAYGHAAARRAGLGEIAENESANATKFARLS